uniref:Laminin G domain-containing protein n=1 Tax=Anopheles christyi TaxID=43041 RepID=A0A182JP39_9DIPT
MASVRAEEHTTRVSDTEGDRSAVSGESQTSEEAKCLSIMESAPPHSDGPDVIRLSARRKCKRKQLEQKLCGMAVGEGSCARETLASKITLWQRQYRSTCPSNSIKSHNHPDNNVCTEADKGANVRQRNSSFKQSALSSVATSADNKSIYYFQQPATVSMATTMASESKAHQSLDLASAPAGPSPSSSSYLPLSLPKIVSNVMVTIRMPKLLLLGLLLSQLGYGCSGFVLDGSQNSFAQFRKWYTGLNGSLELEFKTEQPNGLVLYTDDGGTFDFFELKLVEGALRLRYNLGGGAQIITVGRDLHDGHWHKVQFLPPNAGTHILSFSPNSMDRSEYSYGSCPR